MLEVRSFFVKKIHKNGGFHISHCLYAISLRNPHISEQKTGTPRPALGNPMSEEAPTRTQIFLLSPWYFLSL